MIALATIIVALTIAVVLTTLIALVFVNEHQKRLNLPSEREVMLQDARTLENKATRELISSSERREFLAHAVRIRQLALTLPKEDDPDDL